MPYEEGMGDVPEVGHYVPYVLVVEQKHICIIDECMEELIVLVILAGDPASSHEFDVDGLEDLGSCGSLILKELVPEAIEEILIQK